MPSRPLIEIISVRDALRNDDIYHDVQHLAQQARRHHEARNSSPEISQADPAPSQMPSQTSTWTNSLETTMNGTSRSQESDVLTREDSFEQNVRLTTDIETEATADEDQNPTPRQEDWPDLSDGATRNMVDEDILFMGGQYDDSNIQTDRANQRN